MSERYSKVFSLPENLYAEGAPVVIAAGALLKDNQTGRVVAQLKLRNISPKTIKAATVSLSPMNTVGNPLGDAVSYEYLDLNSTRDTDFGSKSAIPMPDITTRSFDAAVVEVIFTDNSVWNASDAAWEALKSPEALTSRLDNEMVKQFRIEYGSGAKNFFLEQKDLWYCVCGAVNRQGETKCHSSWKAICDLRDLDLDALKDCKEQRLREEQERAKKEAMIAHEKARRAKRTVAMVASPMVAAIVFFILMNSIVVPNGKYNHAVSLMNAGEYEEAIAAFEKMDGYKDSMDNVLDCKYNIAVTLKENGNYTEAMSVFKMLDGYKDSNDKILDCKYCNAITMMDMGQYKEAIESFQALNGYKESTDMIVACNTAILDGIYSNAIALMESGDTIKAYEAFISLNDYKDSSTKAASIRFQYEVEKLKIATVGEYVPFGVYEQDSNIANGKEAIEWLVLDKLGERILVVSKYILDGQAYRHIAESYTTALWENSFIRDWLNNDFLNVAFSVDERALIPVVNVSADKNPFNDRNAGSGTQDTVFLLSVEETQKYFDSDDARMCIPTDYALENGADRYTAYPTGDKSTCLWWLRSPGAYPNYAAVIGFDGDASGVGDFCQWVNGVRPAIWIDLNGF